MTSINWQKMALFFGAGIYMLCSALKWASQGFSSDFLSAIWWVGFLILAGMAGGYVATAIDEAVDKKRLILYSLISTLALYGIMSLFRPNAIVYVVADVFGVWILLLGAVTRRVTIFWGRRKNTVVLSTVIIVMIAGIITIHFSHGSSAARDSQKSHDEGCKDKHYPKPAEYFAKYDQQKVTAYPYEQLVGYLTKASRDYHYCTYDEELTWWLIRDELIRRRAIGELINTYDQPIDETQKTAILHALYNLNGDGIASALRRTATSEKTEIAYYSHMYLAKSGDVASLKVLNNNWGKYPVSSAQWSYTVRLFGKYKYMPAARNMVESGLDAGSLNVIEESMEGLRQMFPDYSPPGREGYAFINAFRNSFTKYYSTKTGTDIPRERMKSWNDDDRGIYIYMRVKGRGHEDNPAYLSNQPPQTSRGPFINTADEDVGRDIWAETY